MGIEFGAVGGLGGKGRGRGGARRRRKMWLVVLMVEARFGLRGTVAIDRGRATLCSCS